jgi:XTP/dITP diphosphohydrolase
MLENLVLASGNPGKIREFDRLLAPLGVTVLNQVQLGVEAADEPFDTFVENALAKARHVSRKTGLPALADDSGICVPSLGGEPGVRSARYAEALAGVTQDEANNRKLVLALEGVPDRRAYYVAVLVLVTHAADPLPVIAQGLWSGEVIDIPQGEHGFGYDPHFWMADLGKTVAQLDPDQKNQLSHRGQAMRAMIAALQSRGLIRR